MYPAKPGSCFGPPLEFKGHGDCNSDQGEWRGPRGLSEWEPRGHGGREWGGGLLHPQELPNVPSRLSRWPPWVHRFHNLITSQPTTIPGRYLSCFIHLSSPKQKFHRTLIILKIFFWVGHIIYLHIWYRFKFGDASFETWHVGILVQYTGGACTEVLWEPKRGGYLAWPSCGTRGHHSS